MILLLLACVFITPAERHARECAWSDRDADGVCDIDDCAPDDATRSPGAPERCNGEDDDCDGVVDDGLYADDDGDGWGTPAEGACFASWVTREGDCDDADARVFPGADDICDGKQNDCSAPWTLADEARTVTHVDEAGVVTDMSPPNPAEVTAYELPPAGDVYVCASPTEPLRATFHVTTLDGDLRLVGISTEDADGDGVADEDSHATIDAARAGTVVRVEASNSASFTMVDLTITGGGREDKGDGGGVWTAMETDVRIARCHINRNKGRFGGVWSEGLLEMVGVTIEGNSYEDLPEVAEAEFFAAGLRAEGPTFVLDSFVVGNIGKDTSGGIDNAHDTLVLNNVTVANNTTAGPGAGIAVRGTLRLVESSVEGNVAQEYAGAGIYVEDEGAVHCVGSTVSENRGTEGAGITLRDETRLFGEACVVSGNTHEDDDTPAEVWAGGELWSPPAEGCFQCDENGCNDGSGCP